MASSSSDSPQNHYPIKTMVVLVQENRSFDHMLGWMKTLNPKIDGVTGSESNPLTSSDPDSTRVHFTESSNFIQPDPGHSFEAVFEQIYGTQINKNNDVIATTLYTKTTKPAMTGFVQQAESIGNGMVEVVMSGFSPDSLPVYRDLVSEFAVCDRWFASVPTLTQPNRLFVHSATSHGEIANSNEMMVKGYPQKTVFESLEENGFSFGVYYQQPPSTLLFRNLRKLKYIDNFHMFDLKFEKHCKEGKLPNYVVIEQRFFETKFLAANDDHPPHDVSEGQRFVKKIYEALRSSPQWNEILFVVIYDEHGGFYDHVAPPGTGVPSPDGLVSPDPFKFEFDRLGVRVPAILISPWIERGTVLHGPSGPYPSSEFEHSSIPATVKKIFNLKDFLTKRDAWAGTFEVVLNRTGPRTDCPVKLSEPVKQRGSEPTEENKLSEFQQEMVQLAAVLNGDHEKDIFPNKLVENMNVTEAVSYVEGAYKMFLDECDKAKHKGADDSHIPLISSHDSRTEKSLFQKIFSCLVCDQ